MIFIEQKDDMYGIILSEDELKYIQYLVGMTTTDFDEQLGFDGNPLWESLKKVVGPSHENFHFKIVPL